MKTTPAVVLPTWMAIEIADVARERNETAGVILAGLAGGSDGLRLLGRDVHWVPEDAYERRTPRSLSIRSSGYVNSLARAEERGDIPIWIHTHPGRDADPRRSKYDVIVDNELLDTFRVRSGADVYASLVFSAAEQWFRFTGLVWGAEQTTSVGRIIIIGDRWSVISADDAPAEGRLPVFFDRQVRAFGGDVQRVLAQLRIAVVGSGGTGSAAAEQLARLGVGSLLLIDPKDLSESNPTRVYGSTPEDIGRPKVEVLASHIRRVAPAVDVNAVNGSITDEEVARLLPSCGQRCHFWLTAGRIRWARDLSI